MIYFRLFHEFFFTGLFIFGGGLASIPFLQQMGDRTGWFTQTELADLIALGESTPGPLGVNIATYVGYVTAGFWGGIIASLALIMPSVIISLIVARLLVKFKNNQFVESAFYGLKPASIALITSAGLTVLQMSIFRAELSTEGYAFLQALNVRALIFAIILFPLIYKLKTHPIVFLAASAVVGIVFRI
jgi:chromate transporter